MAQHGMPGYESPSFLDLLDTMEGFKNRTFALSHSKQTTASVST
jgi:hypothetical protein